MDEDYSNLPKFDFRKNINSSLRYKNNISPERTETPNMS